MTGGLFAAGGDDLVLVFLLGVIIALCVLALFFLGLVAVLRYRNHRKAVYLGRLEARWNPLLLAALSEPDRIPALWAEVPPRAERAFVRFLVRYARRLRGHEREVLRRVAEPYLDSIAEQSGEHDVEWRALALQTLGLLGLSRYADRVVAGLDDPSPLVAMVAARTLARRDHPEYADELLRRLGRFESWSRGYLSAMLASIGPDGAPVLRAAFSDESRPANIRAVVADALRGLNDLDAAAPAAEVVRTETDRELLAASLRLLGRVGNGSHADLLRAHLDAEDPVILSAALRGLGSLGGPEDEPSLRSAVTHSSSWVALNAARALGRAAGPDALEAIVEEEGPRAALARQVLGEGAVV